MATTRLLLLLLCFVPVFGSWLPERDLLTHSDALETGQVWDLATGPGGGSGPGDLDAARMVIAFAEQELGVRELNGKNQGLRVEIYLGYVGLKKGHAWCAAFISWLFGQAGHAKPRSAWSPDLFPASRLIAGPAPASVLGIYFPALKRIAHVGLVTGLQHDWVQSIEGNTNPSGSREGDGVYRRLRHKRFISRYANYL